MNSPTRSPWFRSIAFFIAGTLVGAFAAVSVANVTTSVKTRYVGGGPGPANPTGTLNPTANPTDVATAGPGEGNKLQPPPGLVCAPGRNGGATDQGVTATSIKMATTIVASGIGVSFLGDVRYAMEAMQNKVNRSGGICGRRLDIKYVDDRWQADEGANDLRNFIHEGVFAIPVGPSSEGLNEVIRAGDIRRARVPVVGTDGLIITQYTDPWVWPVAAATVASARIMADNAYARGATKFSIVFDKNYRFGQEAAKAYQAEVKRLTHGEGVAGYDPNFGCRQSFCGIQAGQTSYSTFVEQFEPGDFVAMFLEPTTAVTWMTTPGAPRASSTKAGVGAAQPLFTRDFGNNCQSACDQMWVWTGYKPPIEGYANDPIVRTFVSDLKRTKPDVDVYNAFAEGGYVGMELLRQALVKVGPYLTRERLKVVLDSMSFVSGLTLQNSISWKPGNHFANTAMQAWVMQYKGTFSGWRAGPIVKDPHATYGVS
jgi:ABC-type branched-subunit amino acid transport system substrate-binding protein